MLPRDFAINKSFVDRAKYFSQMLNDKGGKSFAKSVKYESRNIYHRDQFQKIHAVIFDGS